MQLVELAQLDAQSGLATVRQGEIGGHHSVTHLALGSRATAIANRPALTNAPAPDTEEGLRTPLAKPYAKSGPIHTAKKFFMTAIFLNWGPRPTGADLLGCEQLRHFTQSDLH